MGMLVASFLHSLGEHRLPAGYELRGQPKCQGSAELLLAHTLTRGPWGSPQVVYGKVRGRACAEIPVHGIGHEDEDGVGAPYSSESFSRASTRTRTRPLWLS